MQNKTRDIDLDPGDEVLHSMCLMDAGCFSHYTYLHHDEVDVRFLKGLKQPHVLRRRDSRVNAATMR
jgi:hypothetical protein